LLPRQHRGNSSALSATAQRQAADHVEKDGDVHRGRTLAWLRDYGASVRLPGGIAIEADHVTALPVGWLAELARSMKGTP